MPMIKERLRNAGLVAITLPAVVVGALLFYGRPPTGPEVVVPSILTTPVDEAELSEPAPGDPVVSPTDTSSADEAPIEVSPTDAIIDQIASGDIDLFGVMTSNGSETELDDFESAVGQVPDVVQISIGWELDHFDPTLIERITARGALPSIAWEPWDYRPDIWLQPKYSLGRILDGEYDDYIDEWAAGLAATEQPVLLRFAHEANGDWYPWSESRNGNSPGEYTETWRYVHDRFTEAGADNVIWVWAPNVNPFEVWPMTGVYPGDDYVDLIGLVGYWGHFGDTPTSVGTFDSVFGSSITEIRAFTDKPLFISETAASDEGGFKAEWIDEFFAAVAERRDIVGFIWFDVVKEDDWRVDSSPEALAAFLDGLALPAFSR